MRTLTYSMHKPVGAKIMASPHRFWSVGAIAPMELAHMCTAMVAASQPQQHYSSIKFQFLCQPHGGKVVVGLRLIRFRVRVRGKVWARFNFTTVGTIWRMQHKILPPCRQFWQYRHKAMYVTWAGQDAFGTQWFQ